MATIRVQREPFDVAAELLALAASGGDRIGGIGSFVGLVRADANSQGRRVVALTLEHYPGMTERALADIAAEAERRFSLLACTLVHRVGTLPVGAPIVLVLAAAPHRRDALDATGFLIDWLKTGAPFWKRQDHDDGSSLWIEARDDDDLAAARWK
jgi:molybdopterin synthase catalytic subunit